MPRVWTSRSCRTSSTSARSVSAPCGRTACTASSTCIRSRAVVFGPSPESVSAMRPCARTSDGIGGAAPTRSPSRRGGTGRTSTRFAGTSLARRARARPCSGRTCTCSCTSRVSTSGSVIRFSVAVRARRLQYPSVEVGPYVGATLRNPRPQLASGWERTRLRVVDAAGHERERRGRAPEVPPAREVRVLRSRILVAVTFAAALAGSAIPARGQMSCDPCAVGVVFDGPWERNEELRTAFEQEIPALAAPRFTRRVSRRRAARGRLDARGARTAVEALLADSDVDLVLTAGPVASSYAVTRGGLPKALVATFVFESDAQGFPVETNPAGERVSGVPNLAYITTSPSPEGGKTTCGRLQEVVPFDHLTYLASEPLLAAVPVFETNLQRGGLAAGESVTVVPSGLRSLPPSRRCPRDGGGLRDAAPPAPRWRVRPAGPRPGGPRAARLLVLGAERGRPGPAGEPLPGHGPAPPRPPRALHVQRILGGEDASGLPRRLPAQPAPDAEHGDGAGHRRVPRLAGDDRGRRGAGRAPERHTALSLASAGARRSRRISTSPRPTGR